MTLDLETFETPTSDGCIKLLRKIIAATGAYYSTVEPIKGFSCSKRLTKAREKIEQLNKVER